jgi:hypothetical protein
VVKNADCKHGEIVRGSLIIFVTDPVPDAPANGQYVDPGRDQLRNVRLAGNPMSRSEPGGPDAEHGIKTLCYWPGWQSGGK